MRDQASNLRSSKKNDMIIPNEGDKMHVVLIIFVNTKRETRTDEVHRPCVLVRFAA